VTGSEGNEGGGCGDGKGQNATKLGGVGGWKGGGEGTYQGSDGLYRPLHGRGDDEHPVSGKVGEREVETWRSSVRVASVGDS
jgi:hypothetical protein